ncbi:amino acid permease [Xylariomycetidae sp. FL0641]|nr:amino acid permease [Xylariomycetidae sp. FL0641]
MSSPEQHELHVGANKYTTATDVVEKHGKTGTSSRLERQTRTRRLFSFSQLFAFSLTYMALWQGVFVNCYFALYNGGPNTLFFSFVVVLIGALAQAASIGEMASMQPIAGAQYHWTWHLAPPRIRRFVTWIQGWTTWFGYVSILASIAAGMVNCFEAMIFEIHPSYSPGGWRSAVLIVGFVVFQTLVNIFCFRLVPWIEFLGGILHIIGFFTFIAVLAVMAPRNDSSIFLAAEVSSGWDNYGISWNVGVLSSVWLFTGWDGVIHMSEEARTAKQAVPRAMFWSIFTNGLMGLVMVTLVVLTLGPVKDIVEAHNATQVVLKHATNSSAATAAMLGFLFVGGFCCTLAGIASVSRLTWAWARDGGLPAYFGYVDSRFRVPVRAVVATVTIISLLSLLNIGRATYVVFGAITALSSLALFLSYAIAIACMLYSRFASDNLQLGAWNLGRAGVFLNVFALSYTIWVMIFLPFPTTVPVDALSMNYAGPVMGLVLATALIMWFVWARRRWEGPNLSIIEFVVANS